MQPRPIEQIIDDFSFLDDWEDRYRYIIELGRALAPLSEAAHCEANKVRGCASQVWVETRVAETPGQPPVMHFLGDSDALIVKGLIAILLAVYDERPADEILATDAGKVFNQLGLSEHLTPQRSNGFASMVSRIRQDADRALQAAR